MCEQTRPRDTLACFWDVKQPATTAATMIKVAGLSSSSRETDRPPGRDGPCSVDPLSHHPSTGGQDARGNNSVARAFVLISGTCEVSGGRGQSLSASPCCGADAGALRSRYGCGYRGRGWRVGGGGGGDRGGGCNKHLKTRHSVNDYYDN